MSDLSAEPIEALTFDCYGTIIDWDGGILAALRTVPSLDGCELEQLIRSQAISFLSVHYHSSVHQLSATILTSELISSSCHHHSSVHHLSATIRT